MNIKRAFLAAAAVLLVPSFAMAQTTLRFDTGVDTSNGADVTVHATLTCNTGLGLTEEYDVTTDLNVTPVVTEVILAPDTFCGITFSDLPSGYRVVDILTDGAAFPVNQPPHCRWDGLSLREEGPDLRCTLRLAPEPFTYSVTKEWEVLNDDVIDLTARVRWNCQNVAEGTNGSFGTFQGNFNFEGPVPATRSVEFFANPEGGSRCSAVENNIDSSIEADNGCQAPIPFAIGDEEKGCTITNTVFYEGIPTLSQYGLAIMALLMLGVGFVGFRRFV